MMASLSFISFLLIAAFHGLGAAGLKLARVGVPHYKLRGELAVLECQYELEGDTLYAVKWYKENEEFYRFVPKSNPPQQSYKVDGIRVDHSLSDSKQVALRNVNLKSSGNYKCEVSAEGPSFASAQKEARMEVLFLPSNGPLITGEQKQYQIGDEIRLNCTSGKSYPASVLHWYINEQKVVDERLLHRYQNTIHQHGLVSSVLGLTMVVLPQHFVAGSMKLRCVASISPVLWQGDRESVVQRTNPVFDNREAMLLVKGGAVETVPHLLLVATLAVLVLRRSC